MTRLGAFAAGALTGALAVIVYIGYRYLTFQPESRLQQARRQAYEDAGS